MCISYLELVTVKDILKRAASFLVPFFIASLFFVRREK